MDGKGPILLSIPGKHFISAEPLLEPLDLRLRDYAQSGNSHSVRRAFIQGIIAGGESIGNKPGRPAKIEWFIDLKNQCQAAGVPYFLKQMATERPIMPGLATGLPMYIENFKSRIIKMPLLDGRVWDQTPWGNTSDDH